MKRLLCFLPLWTACGAALAATAGQGPDWYDLPLDKLLQVQIPPQAELGARDGRHSALDASVPIDVYSAERLQATGQLQLTQALAVLVPGFNHPRPSIADGTDHAPPFTLRSLNPDQVLVLVNGKRLHQGALLHMNGTIGRGSSGVDLNTIPLLAVERIEVLRDGAAAQYGSDAIAGIINIVLKGYGHGNQAQLGWGRTTRGDGITRQAALFHSTRLAGDGFINLTAELRDRGPTNRANPDALDGGRINLHVGDADTQDGLVAWNAELPRGDTTLFAHGHIDHRRSSAGAFFRHADDERNLPEIYPQGFLPRIEPRISDLSATLGAKGVSGGGSQWSLAYTGGFNDYHFYVDNSLNRSLGTGSPTAFDSGSTTLSEHTLNADLSHNFGPHSLSGGYEYRRTNYRIRQGEAASYQLGPESAWYPGAQGFGGFSPDNEVQARRHGQALYLDLKYALLPQLTLNAATRAEHYSDFGNTLNGKLALGLRPTRHWLLRTSVSSGFRAPSLTQSHFTATSMVRDGNDILQFGNYGVEHPVARALGARDLKPESSRHFTLGTVWQPTPQLSASADGFITDIRNRIMVTSYIAGWNLAQLSPQAQAILQQHQVDGATYFTNAVGTRTRGFDLRLDYKQPSTQGRRWHLSAAYQRASTRITRINRAPPVLGVDMTDLVLDSYTRVTMEAGQPGSSTKLWAQYSAPGYNLAFNLNRFGSFASTYGDTRVRFPARWTLDLQLAYHLDKNTTLTVGGTNVLNAHAGKWGVTDDTLTGAGKPIAYTQYAPFGNNGAAYYLRLGVKF